MMPESALQYGQYKFTCSGNTAQLVSTPGFVAVETGLWNERSANIITEGTQNAMHTHTHTKQGMFVRWCKSTTSVCSKKGSLV